MKDLEEERCRGCYSIGTIDNPVTYGPDPYNKEVHNDNTPVWLCKSCRYEYSLDA